MWTIYYSNIILIMTLAVALFIKSFHLAYKKWTQLEKKSSKERSHTTTSIRSEHGYGIAADYSLQVVKTTMRLSLTAFIYVFSISPLIIVNFYNLYVGFVRENFLRQFLNVYPALSTTFIGVLNVISYAYMSPLFRLEVKNMFVGCLKLKPIRQMFATGDNEENDSEESDVYGLSVYSLSNIKVDSDVFQHQSYYETYEQKNM